MTMKEILPNLPEENIGEYHFPNVFVVIFYNGRFQGRQFLKEKVNFRLETQSGSAFTTVLQNWILLYLVSATLNPRLLVICLNRSYRIHSLKYPLDISTVQTTSFLISTTEQRLCHPSNSVYSRMRIYRSIADKDAKVWTLFTRTVETMCSR